MKGKDRYEDLCRFYGIFVGEIPDLVRFKGALKKTVAPHYLEIFLKTTTIDNLLKRLNKTHIDAYDTSLQTNIAYK